MSLPAGLAIRPLAQYGVEPWRNGGGTTRPLADDPGGGWRISLANVARDGAYSRFDGMARLSLIVSGAGVVLRDGTRSVALTPGEPAAYEGGVAWDATLRDGPVVALNAMAAQGRFAARITPLTDAQQDTATVPSGVYALVLTLGGRCTWSTADGFADDAHGTLDPAEVLTRDASGPPLRLAPRAAAHGNGLCAALVTIEPVHSSWNLKISKGTHA
jgi:uncharacterized protein